MRSLVCSGHWSDRHDGLDVSRYLSPLSHATFVLCRGCYDATVRLGVGLIPDRRAVARERRVMASLG